MIVNIRFYNFIRQLLILKVYISHIIIIIIILKNFIIFDSDHIIIIHVANSCLIKKKIYWSYSFISNYYHYQLFNLIK